jgi:hypothetical protein
VISLITVAHTKSSQSVSTGCSIFRDPNLLLLRRSILPVPLPPVRCAALLVQFDKMEILLGSRVAFLFNLCNGISGTDATTGLLYQPQMIGDGDCGDIGEIKIDRGNRSTGRKPAPMPRCLSQIPHD